MAYLTVIDFFSLKDFKKNFWSKNSLFRQNKTKHPKYNEFIIYIFYVGFVKAKQF